MVALKRKKAERKESIACLPAAMGFRSGSRAAVVLMAIIVWATVLVAPNAYAAPAGAGTSAVSSMAEGVYAKARPRLLQIRTLLGTDGSQTSLGSGFMIDGDGLAITNYHVVSQFALQPTTYRMEYAAPDGSRGLLRLLAIDVTNDLAVVKLERRGSPFFQFDPRALSGTVPKGQRLYAMGNPLDLGFTIVEGTYNSLVDKSYQERIHFTGALNPGMSGGPAVTDEGQIVGINVAKEIDGELVSFLVPARFAKELLDRARRGSLATLDATRKEIGRQLIEWQHGQIESLTDAGFRNAVFGSYTAPETAAAWFTCWSQTNADAVPKPRALVNSTECSNKTWLYISDSLQTGSIEISHAHVKSVDLNAFQFSVFLSKYFDLPRAGTRSREHVTRSQCVEDFVFADEPQRPELRVVWCARALREYEGLYNVSVVAVTRDSDSQALVSKLAMSAVSYENALSLGQRFVARIGVAK